MTTAILTAEILTAVDAIETEVFDALRGQDLYPMTCLDRLVERVRDQVGLTAADDDEIKNAALCAMMAGRGLKAIYRDGEIYGIAD